MDFTRFERSHNTERAMSQTRPRLRGISHRVAAVVSVPAGVWLVVSAPPGTARVAVAIFAATVTFMFTASALVHFRAWDAHTTEVLFRLDHTAIYLVIAGTATPIGLLAMAGTVRTVFLVGVWAVAVVGIVIEWLPPATPRGVAHTLFLVLGWAAVPLLPEVLDNAGWGAVVLLLAGVSGP